MIEVTAQETSDGSSFEKEVGQDLDAFSVWLEKKLGQPLVNTERAILKTYLWYKVKEKDASPDQTNPVEGSHGA